MNWTLADIKEKVLNLTGRHAGDLSDAALLNYINEAYCNDLPQEIAAKEFETFYTLTVALGDTGNYSVPEDIETLNEPIIITCPATGEVVIGEIEFDVEEFFSSYPPIADPTLGAPEKILFYDRNIYVRPLVDQTYTIKFAGKKQPVALANDGDQPLDPRWGSIIAYKAAMEIAMDSGDDETVQRISGMHDFKIQLGQRRVINSAPQGRRAKRTT